MHTFTSDEQQLLLELSELAIKYGIDHGKEMPLELGVYPEKLCQDGACFVTLKIDGRLRGCIGSLEAYRPLVIDVAHNAFAAAFCDPRFHPLTAAEYKLIEKCISILSTPEPMQFTSEEDLLRQLRPGVDGLVLQDKGHRGTFLPAVWEELPLPRDFLNHLKIKAGLGVDYWSATIKISRYITEVIV